MRFLICSYERLAAMLLQQAVSQDQWMRRKASAESVPSCLPPGFDCSVLLTFFYAVFLNSFHFLASQI